MPTMSIADKVASARRIESLLKAILASSGFKLKYRITVDPPLPEDRDWERPDILVELAGPDSPLLLERGGECLRALEHLAQQVLRLASDEHEKVSFDCMNFRKMRLEELKQAARLEADFAVLSPVAPTTSHPEAIPLGWEAFARLCAGASLPVYALGGMRVRDLARARRAGAQGLAMVSDIWGADSIEQAVAALLTN